MKPSPARVAAQHLLRDGPLRTADIADRIRRAGVWPKVEPGSRDHDRQLKKTAETLRNMAALGLIERNSPTVGMCRPINRDGLEQVVAAGLEAYARHLHRPRSARTRR